MKPHPRIRKTVKWGGAAVTVLLAVLWIGSGWWSVERIDGSWGMLCVERGQLLRTNIGSPLSYSFSTGQTTFAAREVSWAAIRCTDRSNGQKVFDLDFGGTIGWPFFTVPLWPLPAFGLFLTVIAWRFDTLARRRARLNLCPKCNYNRAGIAADAKCPECGAMPSENASPPPRP